jgi:hypothetical protein
MSFILYNLYHILVGSPNQEEQDKGRGIWSIEEGANSVLEWKHEGEWPLGIPKNK